MRKKKIILNIVQDFNTGGIQKLLLDYALYYKENRTIDYKILVLDSRLNNEFENKAEQLGVEIIYFKYRCFKYEYGTVKYRIYNFYNNLRLIRYIKKICPEVIHTHNTRMLILIKTSLIKLSKRFPIFHSLHSDPYAVEEMHIATMHNFVENNIIFPICINETQAKKAMKRYSINAPFVIFNSIDVDKFNNTNMDKNNLLNELGIPNNKYIVGSVGRLEHVKNYSFLLDCFNELLKINKNCVLVLCGNGTEKNMLIEKSKQLGFAEKLFILEHRMDVEKIYHIFDVFVTCSHSEAGPLVFLEAQASNLKCVIADTVSLDLICTDNVEVLSLNDSKTIWAEALNNPCHFSSPKTNLDDYRIENSQKKLMDLYEEYKFLD